MSHTTENFTARPKTPKIPYRSYAECEADGYAKGARDAFLISAAVLVLVVGAFLGERILFGPAVM